MPVIIDGHSIRPAPPVSFQITHNRTGDGRFLSTTVQATLRGTIVTDKTDDTVVYHGIDEKLATVLAKQRQLRDWFREGAWFEVQGYDGSAPVKFRVVSVDSIDFAEGNWVDRCDYTIQLTGQGFSDDAADVFHVESAAENWQFEEGEGPHTYRVTHTLSAKGRTTYDNDTPTYPAWQYARTFVWAHLGLDWTTRESPYSPLAGSDLWSQLALQPDSSGVYNRAVNESIDELDGTYSVTETFFVAGGPAWEEYTMTVRNVADDPTMTVSVALNGTVHGLTTQMHDPEGKYANAVLQWNTVRSLLYARAQAAMPNGVTLTAQPSSLNVDHNPNEGTVSYQYEYNDRHLVNDTYEFYNVSMQTGDEDSHTSVTIEGTVTGVRYVSDADPTLKFTRANAQWELVKLTLLSRAITESGIADLKPFPTSASVTPNKQDGSLSYSYTFTNQNPQSVRHEFTVETRYSREDGRTVVSVNGTVTGLRTIDRASDYPFRAYSPSERYDNALAYYNGMSGNIFGLVSTYVDTSKVNPRAYTTSVAHNQYAGTVSYTAEYNSLPLPCVSGALSENITITDDSATQVIAIIPVLGRAKGPVIQDIGTVKERRRGVTIEVVMPVDTNTRICDPSAASAPSIDISPYAPAGNPVYLEQDQTQWSPTNGHYTRQVSWIYE